MRRWRGRFAALLAGMALVGVSLATEAAAQCAGTTCTVTVAADPGTTSSGATGAPGTLSYALAYANASAAPVTINIQAALNITLAGPLSPIFNSVTINGSGATISGSNTQRIFMVGVDTATQNSSAVAGSIIAQRPQVAINNLTLANAFAQGGTGGGSTGGGGLGAGGALFVNQSADVTLAGVTFANNQARGGTGGAGPAGLGGGGGLGGNGNLGGGGIFGNAGVSPTASPGGGIFGNGGGFFTAPGHAAGGGGYTGNGGDNAMNNAGTGTLSIAGLAGSGGHGSGAGLSFPGGANGGGGGGASGGSSAAGGGGGFSGGNAVATTTAGNGGFGGGGGSAASGGGPPVSGGSGGFGGGGGNVRGTGGNGGNGGFGGGGASSLAFGAGSAAVGGNGGFGGGGAGALTPAGSSSTAGNGGFGGGGGGACCVAPSGGSGGFGGGKGAAVTNFSTGLGGGGGGMGGAVFVVAGGSLTINGDGTTSGDSVTGGNGGGAGAGNGQAFGSGFFVQGSNLTFGSGNYAVSDVIADQNGSGGAAASNGVGGTGGSSSITKTGAGALTLSATNTYTGATTVNGGTLQVDGSIVSSILTSVNNGGTLTGIGTVGNTQINTGGTFAPGNGAPGSSMTVTGSLAFQSGALYLVQINPTTSSFANVTGTATLGSTTVNAVYANGSQVAKQYTILTAGSLNGTFGSVVNTNLPSGFNASLSYDSAHAYLDLALNFAPAPGSGLSGNRQGVANAITGFFNGNGSIPVVFGGLTPAGLTQIAGETATGSQQTTFDAMTQFLGVLLDPFIGGRTDGATGGAGATPFAEENTDVNAYASSSGRKRAGAERDAYGMITKAVPRNPVFDPRWSVWAAGFGGSQTTDGNATLGSNNTTSRVFGVAAGADYLLSPRTIAGFALAGGGTNFSVANGGSGRSDLFQAGAFIKHNVGSAYVSAALAYGWQDVTTDRTVTIAGVDRLRAEFNANAFSGRVEGGYRFVTPWMNGTGITPYAAGQFTTFDLPAYAESVLSGANTFALAYTSKSVTASRSELGVRTDKSWAMQDAIFTLRGRFAWAHDFNTDRNIAATFQTLPGASFVVNGAAQARDAALTTASAEMKWLNGWSAAATFEGEFSDVTKSYAGKGIVRYAW